MSQHHRAVPARSGSRRRRALQVIAAVVGAALAGSAAYAVTNWTVGLTAGSGGQAQSGTVSNISITAVASPSPTNVLFPGGNGDVVAQISNPNATAVTITAVTLPANTAQAAGYSNSALTTAQTGCSSSTSGVTWSFATSSSGSSHTLTTPIVLAAGATTTITFTNDAAMSLTTPAACQSTYFQMPSLVGVSASAGAASATSFTTDAWTS